MRDTSFLNCNTVSLVIDPLTSEGGGNASDLSCSGQKGTPGAEQLKNLTTIIKYAVYKEKICFLFMKK